MIGKLIPNDNKSFFMTQHVGTCEDEDGNNYELMTNMAGEPMVKSKLTGHYFSVSWSDIMELAIEYGINKTQEELENTHSTNEQEGK